MAELKPSLTVRMNNHFTEDKKRHQLQHNKWLEKKNKNN